MARDIHVVPLPPQAVLLLEQIHAITGKFDLVFAVDAKPWKTAVREHGQCRAKNHPFQGLCIFLNFSLA